MTPNDELQIRNMGIGYSDEKKGLGDDAIISNEIIREWAYGKRTLYLADPQSFETNWATEVRDDEVDDRLTLFAELLSDDKAKRAFYLLNGLYGRLGYGLSYNENWTKDEVIENVALLNEQTLAWCKQSVDKPYHPMVIEFCREAIEKLQNWEKYNTQVFNFSEWEEKQIDKAYKMLFERSEDNLGIRRPLEEEVPDDGNYVTNEVLREWAHGKRTLVISNQDYQISLANYHGDKNEVFQRMTLCAEMISDTRVPNGKKWIFLNILYERLWMGLWALNREKAREFNIEHGQQTLEWCTSHCKDSYHPAVQEFCKNAKEVLTNWDTYNDSVFDYRKWEHEQIMSAHKKWLPLEDTN